MDVKLVNEYRVIILMKGNLTENIEAFESFIGNIISSSTNIPTKKDMFEKDSDETSNALDEEKADAFHHIVSKLLYVSKRARVDIYVGISYLCNRVSCIIDGDWKKLKSLLAYIKGAIDMPRIIEANSLEIFKMWVDATYTIH